MSNEIICPLATLLYSPNLCLVNAYGRNGLGAEAVDLYWRMPEDMRDSISHVCVLNACSHGGLVDQARRLFEQISPKTENVVITMVGLDCLLLRGND